MFNYEIIALKHGSDRFGPCEVCGKHCSQTFLQNETKDFDYRHKDGSVSVEQTHYGCDIGRFGHEECLIGIRKNV